VRCAGVAFGARDFGRRCRGRFVPRERFRLPNANIRVVFDDSQQPTARMSLCRVRQTGRGGPFGVARAIRCSPSACPSACGCARAFVRSRRRPTRNAFGIVQPIDLNSERFERYNNVLFRRIVRTAHTQHSTAQDSTDHTHTHSTRNVRAYQTDRTPERERERCTYTTASAASILTSPSASSSSEAAAAAAAAAAFCLAARRADRSLSGPNCAVGAHPTVVLSPTTRPAADVTVENSIACRQSVTHTLHTAQANQCIRARIQHNQPSPSS
jgi:hypothetical protein